MDKQIGHYRVVAELGRGGMGIVYRAHEESLNRFVAIKVLGEHLAEDASCVQRFVREAQSAAKLNHPNIVQIYSIAEHDGQPYFVMEYVPGTSVLRLLRSKGHLEPAQAARLVLQTAAGLAEAHDAGIIHRDIKPANLLITERGLLKIADFGLALMTGGAASRLTATGMFMGTPGYLSPEQCLDAEIDHRTDIYSLGVTFFEMLTGKAPFTADSPLALLRQIVDVEPPDVRQLNPEVDDEVRSILQRMMAKKIDQRYQTCQELIRDLQQYLGRKVGAPVDEASLISGTDAAVLVPPQELTAMPQGQPAPAASPAPRPGQSEQLPPASAPSEAAPPDSVFGSPTMAPTMATPSAAPVAEAEIEPISELQAGGQPPPGSRKGISRGAMVAVLLILGLAGAAMAAGGYLIWRSGLVGHLLASSENGEDPESVARTTGTDNGPEVDPGSTRPAADETDPSGREPGDLSALDPEGSAMPVAGIDHSPEAKTDHASVESKHQVEAASYSAPQTASESTSVQAQSRHATAEAGGSSGQQHPSTAVADPYQPDRHGSKATKQIDRRLNEPGAAKAAATSSRQLPPERSVAIVGVGERLLAGEVEAFLEKTLDRSKLRLVDERTIVPVLGLLTSNDDPDPETLVSLVAPHARALLLARAEYLGDRQLRYLGRRDTVYQSRLTITLIDLHGEQQPERSFNEVVEYNQVNVERRVDETLRPLLRRLVTLAALRR